MSSVHTFSSRDFTRDVGAAKRAETRARRVEQYVSMLARGATIYPQKRGITG